MLVRLKKEIIAFGVEGIEPGKKSSAKISAKTLKQWIDEGKPLTLLDTRNVYEIRMGTFEGAIPAGVEHFREFPDAVKKLSPELRANDRDVLHRRYSLREGGSIYGACRISECLST